MTTIHYYPENIRKFIAELSRGNSSGESAPENPDPPLLRTNPAVCGDSSPAIPHLGREERKGVDRHPTVP
jgi:hypothetical protein